MDDSVSSRLIRRHRQRTIVDGRSETSELEGGGCGRRHQGFQGGFTGRCNGGKGAQGQHGILVGVGPSLHCSRRLIHCRFPHPTANRLLAPLSPLASSSLTLVPAASVVSLIVHHLASFPPLEYRRMEPVLLCLIAWKRPSERCLSDL